MRPLLATNATNAADVTVGELALPGNRTATDWLLDAALSRQVVQLGLVPPTAVRLECTATQHRPPST